MKTARIVVDVRYQRERTRERDGELVVHLTAADGAPVGASPYHLRSEAEIGSLVAEEVSRLIRR